MADETRDDGKKNSPVSQIFVGVTIAILAGGTSPWWYNAISGKAAQKPDPPVVTTNASIQTTAPAQPTAPAPQTIDHSAALPVASRQFFIGRWRVDKTENGVHSVNTISYYENGRLDGHDLMGNSYGGQDIPVSGFWQVDSLDGQSFHLMLRFDTGLTFSGDYKIIDQDHIQNVSDNYIAERVK